MWLGNVNSQTGCDDDDVDAFPNGVTLENDATRFFCVDVDDFDAASRNDK